jgi:hypothetical protein
MPVSVQVGCFVIVELLPRTCALGFMAMARVSLCDGSSLQVLVSTPVAEQVAAFVTDHAPYWWMCSGSGVLVVGGKR